MRRSSSAVPAALAVVLAVALSAWMAAPALGRLDGPVPLAFGPEVPSMELPGFGDDGRGSYVLAYEDGAYARITVPVRNDGPVAVTVTRARLSDAVAPLAQVVLADRLPLRLAAGESADVTLTTRLDNCDYYHERELQRYAHLLVDVEVAGRTVTRTVPLARPLLVRSPMIVDCPDRLIDRQAKDRRDLDG